MVAKPDAAWRQPSGARHKALYLNLVYRKRLAYDIGWARLDAFCLVPLSLRSAWRGRVAPTLNQKVENATSKNYSVHQQTNLYVYSTKTCIQGTDKFTENHNLQQQTALCKYGLPLLLLSFVIN